MQKPTSATPGSVTGSAPEPDVTASAAAPGSSLLQPTRAAPKARPTDRAGGAGASPVAPSPLAPTVATPAPGHPRRRPRWRPRRRSRGSTRPGRERSGSCSTGTGRRSRPGRCTRPGRPTHRRTRGPPTCRSRNSDSSVSSRLLSSRVVLEQLLVDADQSGHDRVPVRRPADDDRVARLRLVRGVEAVDTVRPAEQVHVELHRALVAAALGQGRPPGRARRRQCPRSGRTGGRRPRRRRSPRPATRRPGSGRTPPSA